MKISRMTLTYMVLRNMANKYRSNRTFFTDNRLPLNIGGIHDSSDGYQYVIENEYV